jgi:hypothetical protein
MDCSNLLYLKPGENQMSINTEIDLNTMLTEDNEETNSEVFKEIGKYLTVPEMRAQFFVGVLKILNELKISGESYIINTDLAFDHTNKDKFPTGNITRRYTYRKDDDNAIWSELIDIEFNSMLLAAFEEDLIVRAYFDATSRTDETNIKNFSLTRMLIEDTEESNHLLQLPYGKRLMESKKQLENGEAVERELIQLPVVEIHVVERKEAELSIDDRIKCILSDATAEMTKVLIEREDSKEAFNLNFKITLMRLTSDVLKDYLILELRRLGASEVTFLDLPVVEESFDITTPCSVINVIADFRSGRIFDLVFGPIPDERAAGIIDIFSKEAKVYTFTDISLEEILVPQFMVMVYCHEILSKFEMSAPIASMIGEAFASNRLTYVELFLKRGLKDPEVDQLLIKFEADIYGYMQSIDFTDVDEVTQMLQHITRTSQGIQSDLQIFAKSAEIAVTEDSQRKLNDGVEVALQQIVKDPTE